MIQILIDVFILLYSSLIFVCLFFLECYIQLNVDAVSRFSCFALLQDNVVETLILNVLVSTGGMVDSLFQKFVSGGCCFSNICFASIFCKKFLFFCIHDKRDFGGFQVIPLL